jgi:hypothetical protein
LDGGPLIDDSGNMVGLVVRRGQAALEPLALRRILAGEASQAGTPDADLVAARGTGSAAILTKASIFDMQGLTGPGAAPIEAGLPAVVGGVDWVNGGGGLPSFTPSNIPTPPSAPVYSSDDPGSSSSDVSSYDSPADDSSSDSSSSSDDSASSYSPSDSANYQCHAGAPCAWPYEIIGGLVKVLFKGTKLALKGAKALGHKIAEASKRKPKPVVVKPPEPQEPAKPPEPKITGLTLTVVPPNAKLGDTVELVASLQFQGDYKHKDKIPVTLNAPGERAAFAGGLKSITVPTDLNGVASARLTIRRLTKDSAQDAFSALDAEARGEGDSIVESADDPGAEATSDTSNLPESAAQSAAGGAVRSVANLAFDSLDQEAGEPPASKQKLSEVQSGTPISTANGVFLPGVAVWTIPVAQVKGFTAKAEVKKAKESDCLPCPNPPPPVIHKVPPHKRHYPCPGDHEHYFEYHQSPPPKCICRLVKMTRCL